MYKIIFLLSCLVSSSSYAEKTVPQTLRAEGPNVAAALANARASIPKGFVEYSEWTSPILGCKPGFLIKSTDEKPTLQVCKNSEGERSPVTATLTIRKKTH